MLARLPLRGIYTFGNVACSTSPVGNVHISDNTRRLDNTSNIQLFFQGWVFLLQLLDPPLEWVSQLPKLHITYIHHDAMDAGSDIGRGFSNTSPLLHVHAHNFEGFVFFGGFWGGI